MCHFLFMQSMSLSGLMSLNTGLIGLLTSSLIFYKSLYIISIISLSFRYCRYFFS